MVHIKRLEMKGFKSFAVHTVIPLFPGFNAVIGPNGSGKSNILDALSFVLGMRSTGLRADRLESLIFSGSSERPPAREAMVEIVFDNTDRSIPINSDEVSIKRIANTSGYSVYKLNGKTESKRNIDEILVKAGIRPDGHNVIRQGDITRIISMKPLQRRLVIDEIAGITEYNERKEKALKELEEAEKKLSEARVVLHEKREFLERLEKEKNAAQKKRELEERQEWLLACLAFSRLENVKRDHENVSSMLSLKEKELEEAEKQIQEQDRILDEIDDKLNRIEEEILNATIDPQTQREIEDLQKSIYKRSAEIEAKRREIERLQGMIETLRGVEKSLETGNESVDMVLKSGIPGICGTIGSLMRVDPKYQLAIEIAAGNRINDVVTETEEAAIQAIRLLKERGAGRVRFRPLDRLQPVPKSAKSQVAAKMAGIIGYCIDLIDYDPKYQLAFEQVFGDTLVAEDMESARRVRGVRVVTLEGELFEAGGAIIGGHTRPRGKVKTTSLEQLRHYEREIARLENEIEQAKREIGDLNMLLEEKTRMNNQERDIEPLKKEREKLKQERDEARKKRRLAWEERALLEREVQELRTRRARLEADLENLTEAWEKYKDRADVQHVDPREAEKELRRIQHEIRELGLVNEKAIEEYEEYRIEYKQYEEKVETLEKEKKAILDMIARIEQKRRQIFLDTLEKIGREFSEIYHDLTGGNGSLELEKEGDIESGLIIRAQPKGKGLLDIDSLSGGEKTMTSIAFLFAVMRHKPAPFYVLDEIDAALDAENSGIVGDLLREYSKRAQVIAISHNDVLVQKADRIYGVSMKNGVSRVFAVDLSKEKASP